MESSEQSGNKVIEIAFVTFGMILGYFVTLNCVCNLWHDPGVFCNPELRL